MKKVLKYIALTILGLALLALTGFGVIRSRTVDRELTCTGVKLELSDTSGCRVLGEGELLSKLRQECGEPSGKKVMDLDLAGIENMILSIAAVAECEAYLGTDGTLHIEVRQKRPAFRLVAGDGSGVFVCEDGATFPLRNCSADIIVVNGPMPETEGVETWKTDMVKALKIIRKDSFGLKAGKIYCDFRGNVTIASSEGREQFLLGKPEDMEAKLSLISRYYNEIKPAAEAEGKTYRKVNVKFRKQIICS
ncbi:MAG: hypothetical protein HUJ94_07575 [Bacteroidales bacterium]|nr:hypothetical protein [Bacteroidales bacterium]